MINPMEGIQMKSDVDSIIIEFLGVSLDTIRCLNSELADQLVEVANDGEFMQLHQMAYPIHLQLIQIHKEGRF
jgi:hypothetical protein